MVFKKKPNRYLDIEKSWDKYRVQESGIKVKISHNPNES